MRSVRFLLLSLSFYCISLSAQETCSSTTSQNHNYRSVQTLCEQYGTLTPTITTINGGSDQYPGGWNSQIVFVSGTFTINTSSFSITNTIIQFEPGARILVKTGNELTIDKSFLFSCDKMWRGIEALLDSRVRITDSHVEDAQYAIEAKDAQLILSQKTIYERNWTAIRLNQNQSDPTATHLFTGNQFRGNQLKPPFSGQTPLPGTSSFVGIWATSIPFGFIGGGSETNLNRFIDLKIGLIAQRSTFAVNYSTFETMINTGIVEGYQTGIGIFAVDRSTINQTGMGKQGTAVFVGCQQAAIYSQSSTCFTQDSRYIRLGKYGVQTVTPFSNYTHVIGNYFENTDPTFPTVSAVYLERSSLNNDKINDNYIYSTKASGSALIALNDMVGGTGEAEVLRDTIVAIEELVSGIEVRPQNGDNFRISDNRIDAEKLSTGINIYLANGTPGTPDNIVVSENTVTATVSGQIGAYLFNAQGVTLCNNEIYGNGITNFGIAATFSCSGTLIGQNRLDNTSTGLLFQGSGINMGLQDHHGNQWINGFNTWAARHTGPDFFTSRFNVNSDPGSCGNPDYFPNDLGTASVDPATGWFDDISDECVNECTELYDALILQPVFEATALDEGEALGWSPAGRWAADDYLYRSMENQVMTGLDQALLSNFQTSVAQSGIPDLHTRKEQLRSILQADAWSITTTYADYSIALGNYTDAWTQWFTSEETTIPANEDWVAAYQAFQAVTAEEENWRTAQLQDLLDEPSLEPTSFIEEQLNIIGTIKLRWLAGIALSTEEWDTAEELAVQCYNVYGPAVFEAQSLLPPCRWEELREEALLACNNQGMQNFPPTDLSFSSDPSFSVYPNPSPNTVSIQYDQEVLPGDELHIIDLYGREIHHQATELNKLDISEWPAGVYILQWRREGIILATEKLLHQ